MVLIIYLSISHNFYYNLALLVSYFDETISNSGCFNSFFTYRFHGKRSNIFTILGKYGIFSIYSYLFQDSPKFRSTMFVIFITSPLFALRSHRCVVHICITHLPTNDGNSFTRADWAPNSPLQLTSTWFLTLQFHRVLVVYQTFTEC